MAVTIGQVTPGTASATFACAVPPASSVTLTSNDASADIYIGLGSGVSVSNGAPISPYAPLVIINPMGSPLAEIYVIAATSGHAVGYVVSSQAGGTG